MKRRNKPLGLRLQAMALDIPDVPGHPNRVPFSGVLTRVDAPSDRAPHGAAGHRVLLPRAVAQRALPSLLGMAVDFAPGLRGHDARRKIGVITRAEIAGDRLEVSGHLFGKDFPEVLAEIRARRRCLGMSYEITDARVADRRADVWVLEHAVFTGAAILERSAAAYETTSLAATRATGAGPAADDKRGDTMDTFATLSASEKILQALDALVETNRALAAEFGRLQAALEDFRPASLAGRGEEIDTRAADELRRENQALRVQAQRFSAQSARKTLPPQVLTLLAKSGVATGIVAGGRVEVPVLDKALEGLPVEQRIAVKSQLARAGALD